MADIYLEDVLEPRKENNKAPAQIRERVEIDVDPDVFDNYTGRYQVEPGEFVFFNRVGDKLMLEIPGQGEFQLFPESETKFFLKVVDAQLTFQKDENGVFSMVKKHQGGKDQVISRATLVFSESRLEDLSGEYYSNETDTYYYLSHDQGHLYAQINQNPKIRLKPLSENIFETVFEEGSLKLVFKADKNGVTGFGLEAGRVRNIKFYKK